MDEGVAAAASPTPLTKKAVDAAGNPVTTVTTGSTIHWVVTLPQSGSSPAAVNLQDIIQAPQTYVPGSLTVAPPLTGTVTASPPQTCTRRAP